LSRSPKVHTAVPNPPAADSDHSADKAAQKLTQRLLRVALTMFPQCPGIATKR